MTPKTNRTDKAVRLPAIDTGMYYSPHLEKKELNLGTKTNSTFKPTRRRSQDAPKKVRVAFAFEMNEDFMRKKQALMQEKSSKFKEVYETK